ncbi:DoxX family protein [Agrococcus citreus]|uniref:Membrane protein n=1 Tax=Agrococcus citreus TaxID=84643 RepID=A0ABP4JEI7_9MICO
MTEAEAPGARRSIGRTIARVLLGASLVLAGIGHLTVARQEFQAQVPDFVPLDPDLVVLASGVVEIVLGLALLVLRRWWVWVGLIAAAFFIAVFPGNISQWLNARAGFGLDTDAARFGRLFFQPVLVAVALWSTGAWDALRHWWRARSRRSS